MQGNVAYIRPKVVRPFLGPYASGSYMHRVVLFYHWSKLKKFDLGQN
jgi:hypothetical protein